MQVPFYLGHLVYCCLVLHVLFRMCMLITLSLREVVSEIGVSIAHIQLLHAPIDV